jgi:hypothetical protein
MYFKGSIVLFIHHICIRMLVYVQCAKQPLGSQTCGFYTCEYLRACKTYSSSWRQLKKGLEWWDKERINQHNFKQTRADICKFALDKCMLQARTLLRLE